MRTLRSLLTAAAFLILLLALTQCAAPPIATPSPQVVVTKEPSVTPTPTEPTEDLPSPAPWDGDYAKTQPQLCPPDLKAFSSPFFEPTVRHAKRKDGRDFVRQGLVVNRNGELFSIEVTAPDPEAVQAFTDQVQVCFDVVWSESDAIQVDPAGLIAPSLPSGQRTTLITFGFLGAIDPAASITGAENPDAESRAQAVAKIATDGRVPAEEWQAFLEGQIVPTEAIAKEVGKQAMFDFVIDPRITGAAPPHQYKEKNGSGSYTVTVSVADGGGTVRATLCQVADNSSARVASARVSAGGVETASMDFGAGAFDLGIDGLESSNQYRLSGRWSKSYSASAPSGSNYNCPP